MTEAERLERLRRKKGGFTLVEIIAVLVILAILAAVAVAKYFQLTAEAKGKAVVGAVAEAKSLCSRAYAKAALGKGDDPTEAEVVAQLAGVTVQGDFAVTFAAAASADGVDITVVGSGPVLGASTNATWLRPQ